MSQILEKNVDKNGSSYKMMIERYNNTAEMVADLKVRPITDCSFKDMSKEKLGSWEGVKTYNECLNYLQNGYQPTVDSLKSSVKPTIKGDGKRISFKNNIVGGAPIVPLAMIGVPNCMIDTRIKPIKAKVIDIYYDLTCSAGTNSDDIIEAGQKLLGTILKFEQMGYKFNLYAVQTYSGEHTCDMLTIKVKSSNQPLDIKRMSYALTHTSFFRVLGFDWYSRTPKGKYRSCYGRNLSNRFDLDGHRLDDFTKKIFGNNSIFLSAMIMTQKFRNDKDTYINNMINVK